MLGRISWISLLLGLSVLLGSGLAPASAGDVGGGPGKLLLDLYPSFLKDVGLERATSKRAQDIEKKWKPQREWTVNLLWIYETQPYILEPQSRTGGDRAYFGRATLNEQKDAFLLSPMKQSSNQDERALVYLVRQRTKNAVEFGPRMAGKSKLAVQDGSMPLGSSKVDWSLLSFGPERSASLGLEFTFYFAPEILNEPIIVVCDPTCTGEKLDNLKAAIAKVEGRNEETAGDEESTRDPSDKKTDLSDDRERRGGGTIRVVLYGTSAELPDYDRYAVNQARDCILRRKTDLRKPLGSSIALEVPESEDGRVCLVFWTTADGRSDDAIACVEAPLGSGLSMPWSAFERLAADGTFRCPAQDKTVEIDLDFLDADGIAGNSENARDAESDLLNGSYRLQIGAETVRLAPSLTLSLAAIEALSAGTALLGESGDAKSRYRIERYQFAPNGSTAKLRLVFRETFYRLGRFRFVPQDANGSFERNCQPLLRIPSAIQLQGGDRPELVNLEIGGESYVAGPAHAGVLIDAAFETRGEALRPRIEFAPADRICRFESDRPYLLEKADFSALAGGSRRPVVSAPKPAYVILVSKGDRQTFNAVGLRDTREVDFWKTALGIAKQVEEELRSRRVVDRSALAPRFEGYGERLPIEVGLSGSHALGLPDDDSKLTEAAAELIDFRPDAGGLAAFDFFSVAIQGMLLDMFNPTGTQTRGAAPGVLVVGIAPRWKSEQDLCQLLQNEQAQTQLAAWMRGEGGRRVRVKFVLIELSVETDRVAQRIGEDSHVGACSVPAAWQGIGAGVIIDTAAAQSSTLGEGIIADATRFAVGFLSGQE